MCVVKGPMNKIGSAIKYVLYANVHAYHVILCECVFLSDQARDATKGKLCNGTASNGRRDV